MEKRVAFIIIFAAWVLIAAGLIGFKEFTLGTGEKVLLKTAPVDPRDFLRGDYVILSYEISRLDVKALLDGSFNLSQGDSFYLLLEKGEKYWSPKKITKQRPTQGMFIKGEVTTVFGSGAMARYGIENYFVPEGKGLEVERAMRGRNSTVDVEVTIDKFGNAILSGLYLNDELVKFK